MADLMLGLPKLSEAATTLTAIGDRWREFAVQGALLCKGRGDDVDSYVRLADILRECADREEKLFRELKERV